MRFGLSDGVNRTLAEIAKVLGVSRERVRQLEEATIKKIRQIIKEKAESKEGNVRDAEVEESDGKEKKKEDSEDK